MSKEELEMWTAKLKLWCILHGTSLLHYYKDKSIIFKNEPCGKCPLYNKDRCIDIIMLWINSDGQIAESTRKNPININKYGAGNWCCVEWIKHV